MTTLVLYLLLFLAVGIFFVFFHLMLGKMVRPARPDPEKLTIYECGEPTIGSSWVQFDLRFYVVALLFVIFDVEVVFFFPWAVVFGQANTLAAQSNAMAKRPERATERERQEYARAMQDLVPAYPENRAALERLAPGAAAPTPGELRQDHAAAGRLAWLAFWDILVFFGVLLVGFAYLWRRGDLAWVRSVAAERPATPAELVPPPAPAAQEPPLVGAGQRP
jgi:NADH-quinone oxidoreductase subunit A